MKTQHELQYEELIFSMILSDNKLKCKQQDLVLEFHRNSGEYYDLLCDALHILANRSTTHPLWLTPSGKPYLACIQKDSGDRMLLTYEQVPVFTDDLKDQLDTVIRTLQKLCSKYGNLQQIL